MAVVALFVSPVFAGMRVWEDTSGRSFEGEYVRTIFGRVTLRAPDGKPFFVSVTDLSPSDLKYIQTIVPPTVQIKVRKKEVPKVRNQVFVAADDFINVVTLSVKVEKTSKSPYDAELKAEFYLIGKEVATDDYRLFDKGTSPVAFTEENTGTFEFSASADVQRYADWNTGEERGATYAGYLVVVLDPQGHRIGAKTDLSWLDDEKKIDALRALRVGNFFDENCRKRSVPRPHYTQDRRAKF
ncbi:MAG: hypothetical protein PHP93_05115 [Kiritimatiellales bacterium]|nr:hypothetical protein [Kiritimatiellales bacterium]